MLAATSYKLHRPVLALLVHTGLLVYFSPVFGQATPSNSPPSIAISVSEEGLISPATFRVRADVSDSDGSISFVAFSFSDDRKSWQSLGTAFAPPFEISLTNFVSSGGYLQAIATDELGAKTAAIQRLSMVGLEGDDSRRPISIAGENVCFQTNNSTASTEFEEFSYGRSPKSIYWIWTAPVDGIAHFSTEGSSFDTDLEIQAGARPSTEFISFNDDFLGFAPASFVKLSVQKGLPYRIRVGSTLTNTGTVFLRVSYATVESNSVAPPDNDNFSNAFLLEGTNIMELASNLGATGEADEPYVYKQPGNKSVWWRWRCPDNLRVTILCTNSTFDTRLAVCEDTSSLSAARFVAANDDWHGLDSHLSFNGRSNSVYLISLNGAYQASGRTTLRLSTQSFQYPTPNNHFTNRTRLAGDYVLTSGNNYNGTMEAGEPPLVEPYVSASVWWSWTAAHAGPVQAFVQAEGIDGGLRHPALGVFAGDAVTNLTQVAQQTICHLPAGYKSFCSFQAEAGKDYHFLVVSSFGLPRIDLAINATQQDPLRLSAAPRLLDYLSILHNSGASNLTLESSSDFRFWSAVDSLVSETNLLSVPILFKIPAMFFRARVDD